MGFATQEELDSQIGAYVREKETSEVDLAKAKEEFEAAQGLNDQEQIIWWGREIRRLEKNVRACTEQLGKLSSEGMPRSRRASKR